MARCGPRAGSRRAAHGRGDRQGGVLRASLAPEGLDEELSRCVLAVVEEVRFPEGEAAETTFLVDMAFVPRDPPPVREVVR